MEKLGDEELGITNDELGMRMKTFTSCVLLTSALALSLLVRAQTPEMVLQTGKKNISKILFNSLGTQVYFSCSSSIYSLMIGAAKLSDEYKHVWNVRDFSISPDNKTIYSTDGKTQVWSSDGVTKIRSDFSQSSIIRQIEISPDNQQFVFCSWYEISKVLLPNYVTQNITTRTDKIAKIKYNSDGSFLAVGYNKAGVDIWDTKHDQILCSHYGEISEVTSLCFSKDDQYLFLGNADGSFITYSIKDEKLIRKIPGTGTPIIGIFQINNYIVITIDSKGTIDAFEFQTGNIIKKLKTETNDILCLDFCADKNLMVFAKTDGSLVFYDIFNMLQLPATTYYVLVDSINQYVRSNLNLWQQRGKYERTEDFIERVNEQSREKKIVELTTKATNKFGQALIKSKNSLLTYDPDNEYFKLSPEDIDPIYLKVPIDEALSFETNYRNCQLEDLKFALAQNRLIIQDVTFINPENQKRYHYNGTNTGTFSTSQISLNFDDVKINIPEAQTVNEPLLVQRTLEIGKSDVDKDIPEGLQSDNPNIYALVIGNEDYTTYQTNLGSEVTVDYAANDAEIFGRYLSGTLRVPEKNITLMKNATYAQMMRTLNKFETISEILDGKAELIFYYSGHGLPDETTKEAYIMPVDASATTLESAIKLNDVLGKLTTYPSVKVLAIIDACFSGGGRNQGLLAMKSVKIKPNEAQLHGNLVVLSSSTGEESSGVYREKQHGMFTYFLLKKLQESKGDITLQALSDYIKEKVELESVVVNNKRQTPQVLFSQEVDGAWEAWKLVGGK